MAQEDLQLEILYHYLLCAQLFNSPFFCLGAWHIPMISSTYGAKAGIHLNLGDHGKLGDVARAVSVTQMFPFHHMPLGCKLCLDILRFQLTVISLHPLCPISLPFKSLITYLWLNAVVKSSLNNKSKQKEKAAICLLNVK